METILTYIILLLVLFGLYKLFGKILPVQKAKYLTDKPVEELRKKYFKSELLQLGLFVLMAIGLIFVLYYAFDALINIRLSFVSDVVIIVKPYAEMVMVMAFFTGLLLASLIMLMLTKRLLKADWAEYLAYQNVKYKFDYIKLTGYTVRVFILITFLLIIGFLDWYSAFGQNEIKINRLLSLGPKTYSYSSITQIKDIEKLKAPNGNIIEDPHFIIEFKDGKKWNSRDNGFADYDKDNEIIDLIIGKTGIEPLELEFDNEN